ncbi:hypothetical protein C8R46DRAFT_310601 [Mycena filopes]|nr:hypothetical protein C8R46DRAFT_310601 [Mycena filopes]
MVYPSTQNRCEHQPQLNSFNPFSTQPSDPRRVTKYQILINPSRSPIPSTLQPLTLQRRPNCCRFESRYVGVYVCSAAVEDLAAFWVSGRRVEFRVCVCIVGLTWFRRNCVASSRGLTCAASCFAPGSRDVSTPIEAQAQRGTSILWWFRQTIVHQTTILLLRSPAKRWVDSMWVGPMLEVTAPAQLQRFNLEFLCLEAPRRAILAGASNDYARATRRAPHCSDPTHSA